MLPPKDQLLGEKVHLNHQQEKLTDLNPQANLLELSVEAAIGKSQDVLYQKAVAAAAAAAAAVAVVANIKLIS
jgi:hypothetical protein